MHVNGKLEGTGRSRARLDATGTVTGPRVFSGALDRNDVVDVLVNSTHG
ncbi:hypothetical protein [Lentzea sp. CA-135723]